MKKYFSGIFPGLRGKIGRIKNLTRSYLKKENILFGSEPIKGDGKEISSERFVGEFKSIEVEGVIDLDYVHSERPFLKITTDSNLHKHIKTEVVARKLIIGIDGKVSQLSKIAIECGSPNLSSVHARKGAYLDLVDIFNSAKLTVIAEGESDVYVSGSCGRVAIKSDSQSGIETSDLLVKGKIKENGV